jgi:hypothetical protein
MLARFCKIIQPDLLDRRWGKMQGVGCSETSTILFCTRIHSLTFQKTEIFIFNAVRNSDIIWRCLWNKRSCHFFGSTKATFSRNALPKKKFWEELIAYFPWYVTDRNKNGPNNSSILACVFIIVATFLPSRCLATIRGFLPNRAVT